MGIATNAQSLRQRIDATATGGLCCSVTQWSGDPVANGTLRSQTRKPASSINYSSYTKWIRLSALSLPDSNSSKLCETPQTVSDLPVCKYLPYETWWKTRQLSLRMELCWDTSTFATSFPTSSRDRVPHTSVAILVKSGGLERVVHHKEALWPKNSKINYWCYMISCDVIMMLYDVICVIIQSIPQIHGTQEKSFLATDLSIA